MLECQLLTIFTREVLVQGWNLAAEKVEKFGLEHCRREAKAWIHDGMNLFLHYIEQLIYLLPLPRCAEPVTCLALVRDYALKYFLNIHH